MREREWKVRGFVNLWVFFVSPFFLSFSRSASVRDLCWLVMLTSRETGRREGETLFFSPFNFSSFFPPLLRHIRKSEIWIRDKWGTRSLVRSSLPRICPSTFESNLNISLIIHSLGMIRLGKKTWIYCLFCDMDRTRKFLKYFFFITSLTNSLVSLLCPLLVHNTIWPSFDQFSNQFHAYILPSSQNAVMIWLGLVGKMEERNRQKQ